MVDKKLLDYVRSNLEKGYDLETIKETLAESGWSLPDIEQALNIAQGKELEEPLEPESSELVEKPELVEQPPELTEQPPETVAKPVEVKEQPKAKRGRPRKVNNSDQKEKIEKLEKEKTDLTEKGKSLLGIIEELSKSRSEPEENKNKKEDKEEKIEKEKPEEEKSLFDLKEFGEKIKERFEENKSKEDLKKDLTKMIKENVDSKFSELSKDLKKVSSLEEKINKLAQKPAAPTAPAPIPAPQLVPPEAYGVGKPPPGAISKGLAAFGEEIDLQTELAEIKKSIGGLDKNLENLKKKTDYSITSIEDKIKILEKIPILEENFQSISEKLGPDNVQKLRKLIFSADELADEVIPDLIGKKIRAKVGPTINEVKSLRYNIERLRTSLNGVKVEILNLQKMKEEIKALELEKDRLYKEIIGRDEKFREGVDILKGNVRKRIETLSTELSGKVKESHKAVKKDVNKMFSDVIQTKLSEIEKSLVLEKKRISDLEDELKAREMEFSTSLDKQKDSLTDFRLEIGKMMDSGIEGRIQDLTNSLSSDMASLSEKLKDNSDTISYLKEKYNIMDSLTKGVPKKIESQDILLNKIIDSKEFLLKRSEAIAAELKSLSGNLSAEKDRLMALEQKIGIQDKAMESRIHEIDDIKAKVDELESVDKSLSEKSVSESEFISTVKSISKRIDDVENLYGKLDKELSLDNTKLNAAINQALSDDRIIKSTQGALGKRMEEELQKLNEKFYSDIEKQSEQLSDQQKKISELKERVQALNSLTKDFPKKFDLQTRELSDLMGSEGFLTKKIESLDSGLNNLNEKIDSSNERTTTLEKEIKSHSKAQETRLDGMDSGLASIQSGMQESSTEIGVLKERLNDMEKRFEQSVKRSIEEKHLLGEELKKQSEKVGKILRELRE